MDITLEDISQGKVLLINKPLTWTSFSAVNKLKWLIKNQLAVGSSSHEVAHSGLAKQNEKKEKIKFKIGHAGTLDPLATGLLIVCVGKETKKIDQYQAKEKEYTGTFFIGATTPCYDLEQPIDKEFPTAHITEEMIIAAAKKFTGTQMQTPPQYSAVKIKGKRAYDSAREGKTVVIAPKEITITEFELTRIALPEIDFRIVCSKGTYIRSLARDLGEELQSGAHLTKLCRTRIGEFKLEDAKTIEEIETELKPKTFS